MKFQKGIIYLALFVLAISAKNHTNDEGMFPLSYLSSLDLKKAGLEIDVKEIYNPKDTSLLDALVRIDGCTGSFVSENGLIFTNHHCAFSAIRAASTVEHNYLKNGFVSSSINDEIKTSVTCRITLEYKDVTQIILSNLNKLDFVEKSNRIAFRIDSLQQALNTEKAKSFSFTPSKSILKYLLGLKGLPSLYARKKEKSPLCRGHSQLSVSPPNSPTLLGGA